MDEQQLILVDEKDNFFGYAPRKECHFGKGKHHRAFVVCLFNNKNQILLQKRKHKLWDGYWDVTAISHPLHLKDHDESYEEAGNRALKIEMGIDHLSLKDIGGFNYFAEYSEFCENEYCAVLIGLYKGQISANPNVVYEYLWMDKKQFMAECKNTKNKYAPWTIYTAHLLTSTEY